MTGAERSLLSFVDTPVIVGDPEGYAAYVNPAFEGRFGRSRDAVVGQPLAEIFEGGGREAVLRAVAEVCQYGESVRFRVREAGIGFAAVASPIVAEDARVGVVILLKEEVEGVERLLALHRELRDPLDELAHALEALADPATGPHDDRHRVLVDDAVRSLDVLRKWAEHASAVLCGSPAAKGGAALDPCALVRTVARRIERDAARVGTRVEVLAATALPAVRGATQQVEAVLQRLVAERLQQPEPPAVLTLTARALDASNAGAAGAVLLSVVERPRHGSYAEPLPPSALIKEGVAACGGAVHASVAPNLGRVVVIRLPA